MRIHGQLILKKDSVKFYACPACRADLTLRQEFLVCTNPECRRRYDIINVIPSLTIEGSIVLHPSVHEGMIKG